MSEGLYEMVTYPMGGVFLPAGVYSLADLEELVKAVQEMERRHHDALQKSIQAAKLDFEGPKCN
jgi:hypothetical protein